MRGTDILKAAALTVLFLTIVPTAVAFELQQFAGHKNGLVEGFEKVDEAMFRATPRKDRFFAEAWFHELQFEEEGIIVTFNFQIHNMGLFKRNGEIVVGVSDASSGLIFDRVSFSPGKVKIDKQGFGISMGKNRMELDGNTYRVKFRGKNIQADFTWDIQIPGYQQGDGIVDLPDTDDFVRFNLPIPLAQVEGELTYNGSTHKLVGKGCMNHDWQVLSPKRYMSDWQVFWLQGPGSTINICNCTSSTLDGKWSQRLLVADKGRNVFSSHDYQLEELDVKPVPGGRVDLPRRFRVTADHGAYRLNGEIQLTSIQENFYVLKVYPFFFRKFASMVVNDAWLYRFWCDYRFELTMDGNSRIIEGKGTGHFVQTVRD